MGTTDIFGTQRDVRISELHSAVAATQADVVERSARIGELHAALVTAHDKLATTEAQIGEIDRKARELGVSLQRLINSRSWRLTAPFRALLAALKRG